MSHNKKVVFHATPLIQVRCPALTGGVFLFGSGNFTPASFTSVQFLPYTSAPSSYLHAPGGPIASFMDVRDDANLDADTVASFGTPLERRFSRGGIKHIMRESDLDDVRYFDAVRARKPSVSAACSAYEADQ